MNVEKILEQASKLRIAVVGDLILDRYIDGVVERISPEAPVQILKITGTRENHGGAGNVVENLKGLGCQVSFFHQTDTPIKTRVMSGNHHLLRMDDEDEPRWMSFDEYDIGLDYGIHHKIFDCVVISDYSKGAISRDVTSKLIRKCNDNDIPIVVDTKHQLHLMHHAKVVKCNEKEWKSVDQPFPESPWTWMDDHDVTTLVVTHGSRGMQYSTRESGFDMEGNINGLDINICDPCGAGDTVTAVLAIMEAVGAPVHDACTLANIAASEVCKHPGVYAIQKEDLIRRYNEVHS